VISPLPTASPPIACQLVPSQRATLFTVTPPAVPNNPAATTSPFGSVVSRCTVAEGPVMPPPSGDHVLPFQLAMLFAATPPADVKLPAAISSPFGRVVSTLTHARDGAKTPVPSGDHVPVAAS
jgi:hypothetical protein